MEKLSVVKNRDLEKVPTKAVYRFWWAKELLYRGFRLIGIDKSTIFDGQVIYFFERTPELMEVLQQMIDEHNNFKNREYQVN